MVVQAKIRFRPLEMSPGLLESVLSFFENLKVPKIPDYAPESSIGRNKDCLNKILSACPGP
jgi:hypothetical protein